MNAGCYERGLFPLYYVTNGSRMNVVCYEGMKVVSYEMVCNEHTLLWTWFLM